MNLDLLFNTYKEMNLDNGRHLLAFSAGSDSVFLLVTLGLFLKDKLNEHISLAYIDYHDSDEVYKEEELVSYYVDKYSLTLFKCDAYQPENTNFENWAREFRYSYFNKIIHENSLSSLLVAHHLDDSIETYLIQKNRRSLPLNYGLKKENIFSSIKIFRPLLDITKKEIYSFLHENNYLYYEDKTNKNLIHERNRIRTMNISTDEKIKLKEEMDKKNKYLSSLYSSFSSLKKTVSFSFYDELNDDDKKRLIFYLLNKETENIPVLQIEKESKNIFSFLKRKENNILPIKNNFYICKTDTFFFITDKINKKYHYHINKPVIIHNEYFNIDLSRVKKTQIGMYPLEIRNFKKGDTFSSNIKTKDVDEFLSKHKVPFYLKELYPVFLYKGDVIFSPFYQDNEYDFYFTFLRE